MGRSSELRKFKDTDAEFRETNDPKAAKKRAEAMRELSPEDHRRASETILGRVIEERESRDEKLRKVKFSGFKRKDD